MAHVHVTCGPREFFQKKLVEVHIVTKYGTDCMQAQISCNIRSGLCGYCISCEDSMTKVTVRGRHMADS